MPEAEEPILAGLRVIDAATYIAAPAAAAVLADFGAEIIKIERPPLGDPYRHLYLQPEFPPSEINYPFLVDNRNKRSVVLNLATEGGRGVLLRLVDNADIFITNYQPQLQQRFGLRYEDLAARNQRLIYALVTGYGEQGEEAEKPGYDMTAYYARSGLMNFLHNADAEPCLSACGMGDHPTGMSLVAAILLALYRRAATGRGGKVTTTLMHNGVWSNASMVQGALAGAGQPVRRTRRTAPNPLVNHYGAADGKRFVFCLLDAARDWGRVCNALARPDLAVHPHFATPEARRDHNVELIALLDAEFDKHGMAEWTRRFHDHDVLFGIVADNVEVAQDRQMENNGVFVPIEGGPDGLHVVTSPLHVEGAARQPARVPPSPGQHTRDVLAELGYDSTEIAAMEAAGEVGGGQQQL